jgi:drug/metabolite transporter (DMT)-like permease
MKKYLGGQIMKEHYRLKNSIVICLLASLCCALWGSAFPFVKIGYSMLEISSQAITSQILFAGMRFTLAGILTIIIGSILSGHLLLPTRSSRSKLIWLALLQTVLQYVFFYIGLSHTSGVKASIIEGINVFVALLVASFVFRQEKLTTKKIFGSIIGFLGVIIINFNSEGFSMDFRLIGEGFVILSTVAYAFSSVLFKHYTEKENAIMLSGYQFVLGGLVMMAIGFLPGGRVEMTSWASVGLLFYLALVSAVAYALWGILLKYNPVSKVAVYGFMTPVFGVLLSAILLKENRIIGYKGLLALILVSVGIYIVNYNKTTANTGR